MFSNGLTKRGPGARKIGGPLFTITKQSKTSNLLKKAIALGGPLFSVSKQSNF